MKKALSLMLLLTACHHPQQPVVEEKIVPGHKVGTFSGDTSGFAALDSAMPWPDPNRSGYVPEDTIEPYVRSHTRMRNHPLGWWAPYHQLRAGGQLVRIFYEDTVIVTRLDSMAYYDKKYSHH